MCLRKLLAGAVLALLSFSSSAQTYPPGTVTSGGLTWTKPDATLRAYVDASAYCANSTIAGQTGWRLPTYHEFELLWADRAKVYEQNWTLDWFWTMTPFRAGHLVVKMLNGTQSWGDMSSASVNYVTCVRGTSNAPATTTGAGLTWMKPDQGGRTYASAEEYCTNLGAVSGQTGWRLPTETELVAMHTSSGSEFLAGAGWTLDWIWTSTPYGGYSKIVRDKGEVSWTDRTNTTIATTCVYPGALSVTSQYYPRDGSQPLTGTLAGGGQDATNLRNIGAAGTLTVPRVDTTTLNVANIKPTQTVADNSACDPATQGYFAKNSGGTLLSCQAGAWGKLDQASLQTQLTALQTQLTSLTATTATQEQLAALQVQCKRRLTAVWT